jgi:hypothetical protein
VRDTSQLDPLVAEYEATLCALQDLAEHYMAQRRRRKRIKPATVRRIWEGGRLPWEVGLLRNSGAGRSSPALEVHVCCITGAVSVAEQCDHAFAWLMCL